MTDVCDVPPVVVKVSDMAAYAVLATVPYLHEADSFVVNDRVVWVVPAGSTPVGDPADKTGGVVSAGGV